MVGFVHNANYRSKGGGKGKVSIGDAASSGDDGNETTLLNNINEELKALYNYLEKHEVSGTEMNRILEPLMLAVEGDGSTLNISQPVSSLPHQPNMMQSHHYDSTSQPANSNSNDNNNNTTTTFADAPSTHVLSSSQKMMILLFLLSVAGYAAIQIPFVYKMLIVFLRHFQVMLLPYWDWSRLYYADCLITNPYYVSQGLTRADCNVCESVESLDVLSSVPVSVATDEYLRDDRPFLVTDAMSQWHVMNTDDFWFDNITELYQSGDLRDVYPCELTTNLRVPPDDLQTFLRRIHLPAVDRWYGHWENCNKKAAKALRSFYQRPYFMPHMVDFSDTNWVLMSSDYKAKVYKEIVYQSEVLWLAAVRGWWHVRVVPLDPCNQHCPELTATITEGQMIVVTNRLWKLEYIPGEETDNLALAVGGFWN